MFEIREYTDAQGNSPFAWWFKRLDPVSAAKITTALYRMNEGNLSNAKGIGAGLFEQRIHFGPGYRIYFGRDGDRLIILLAGGTKARQQRDIKSAKVRWQDYRRRK